MTRTVPQPAEFSRFRIDYGPLAARRRFLNLSQRRLAASVGVHRITINRLETGRQDPSKSLLVAISRALGTPEHLLYTVRDLDGR